MAETANHDTNISIEARLESLECTVKALASSVDEALRVFSAASPPGDLTKRHITSNQTITDEAETSNQELYIGPSHSFSFIQEAPANIAHLPRQGPEDIRQGAISEIHNISSSLRSTRTGAAAKNSTGYHVPLRSAGYVLLGSEPITFPLSSNLIGFVC